MRKVKYPESTVKKERESAAGYGLRVYGVEP